MKVLMVNMPWQSLDYPSLALSILRVVAGRARSKTDYAEYYGNLEWAEFLLYETDGALTPKEYYAIADDGLYYGIGDWVFTSALYGVAEWKLDEYVSFLDEKAVDPAPAVAMHRLAPRFVQRVAERIAEQDVQVVGFSTTFMQNVPSLALARCLKELRPDIQIVFGGGNCEGVQGVTLHRHYKFVDYVICGEAERSFPQLLDAIGGLQPFEAIAGLCWRHDGDQVVNPPPRIPIPVDEIPQPLMDGYFRSLDASVIQSWVEPKLVLESARGCWWGEKHQCTFCGLNGSFIKFRSKPADVMWSEIENSVARHQVLDIIMVDNILDMRYVTSLLPRLEQVEWDVRLHYEVKSNLRKDQVRMLRGAGVMQVQPGIESLNSRVLKLMDKGVTGAQNLQVLRDSEELGLTVPWNYLYGFPGESDDDYWPVIEQMPALVHLQPPVSPVRVVVERFSPFFERPELGFRERTPARFYSMIYQLPTAELEDLVYMFDSPPAGASEPVVDALRTAIEKWIAAYERSSLTYQRLSDRILVHDPGLRQGSHTPVFR